GTTRTRPPPVKALTTPEVTALSTPGSSVRFLNIGTATVLMWEGRLPRVPYPQPARRTAAMSSAAPGLHRPRVSATGHHVDEAAGHHHDLRDAPAVQPREHLGVGQRLLADLGLLGIDVGGEPRAHAAVDLHHDLDLVARERRLVRGRPGLLEQALPVPDRGPE